MRTIGITGGVGAGKSALLEYIKERYHAHVLMADEAAHLVKEPGGKCYDKLVLLLGKEILNADGTINKKQMAEKIFADGEILEKVNQIIHPAVKELIVQEIAEKKAEGKTDFFFVEAALLIEDGYERILDELWYVYARTQVRRDRLRESRSYSDKKIDQIIQKQLSEEAYRRHCRVVIDNSGSLADACRQIDEKLEEYLCQR